MQSGKKTLQTACYTKTASRVCAKNTMSAKSQIAISPYAPPEAFSAIKVLYNLM